MTAGAARRNCSGTGRSSNALTPQLPKSRQVSGIAVAPGSAARSACTVLSPAWTFTNSSMSRTKTQSAAAFSGCSSARASAVHCGPFWCGPSFRTWVSQPIAASRTSIRSVPAAQSFERARTSVKPAARWWASQSRRNAPSFFTDRMARMRGSLRGIGRRLHGEEEAFRQGAPVEIFGHHAGAGGEDGGAEDREQPRQPFQPFAGQSGVEGGVVGAGLQLGDRGPVRGDGALVRGADGRIGHEPVELRPGGGKHPPDRQVLFGVVVHAEPVVEALVAVHVVHPAPVALHEEAFGRAHGVVVEL